MPNSCKSIIKRLRHNGAITQAEYDKLMRKFDGWVPISERLPSEEERKEWIDKNLDGIGYLYPCLVTRYSSINPDRTKNNPYVAKHYYDGEDFVNNGEEVCSEHVLAWMPLPEPYDPDANVGEMESLTVVESEVVDATN